MEGRAIKAKYAGTAGLLHDAHNERDRIRLGGGKPKNHTAENVKKMRQQARDRKEAEAEKAAIEAEKKAFKLSQFKDVRGKAKKEADQKGLSVEEKHEYTKAGTGHSCVGKHQVEKDDNVVYVPKMKTKPRAPSKDEALATAPVSKQSTTNFVNRNFSKAVKNEVPNRTATSRSQPGPSRTHAVGKVPNYIKERKQAIADRKQWEIDNYDPECPEGMAAMPETERIGALDLLNQNKHELTQKLGKLSFQRSLATDRKQNEIYDKLKEIDSAIEVFSKPKVYVRCA